MEINFLKKRGCCGREKENGGELSVQGTLIYDVTFKLKLKGVSTVEQGRREKIEVEAILDGKERSILVLQNQKTLREF